MKELDTSEKVLVPAEWEQEFEAAARRPLAPRFRYPFIHTYYFGVVSGFLQIDRAKVTAWRTMGSGS